MRRLFKIFIFSVMLNFSYLPITFAKSMWCQESGLNLKLKIEESFFFQDKVMSQNNNSGKWEEYKGMKPFGEKVNLNVCSFDDDLYVCRATYYYEKYDVESEVLQVTDFNKMKIFIYEDGSLSHETGCKHWFE